MAQSGEFEDHSEQPVITQRSRDDLAFKGGPELHDSKLEMSDLDDR